jgi:hypothetical protein
MDMEAVVAFADICRSENAKHKKDHPGKDPRFSGAVMADIINGLLRESGQCVIRVLQVVLAD